MWRDYYANYRLVFLVMVLKAVVPPLAIAAIICKIASWRHSSYTILTYVLATPIHWTIRIQYDSYVKQRDAARRGAILVPEVKGKWIGNVDLIFWLGDIIRTGYIMDDFNQLFERAGNNVHTINVRILWSDAIFTRDHRIAQHVLTTGFSDFNKGAELKLLAFSLFGNGIINSDGAEWKAHRALVRPFFVRERITDYGHFDKYSNKVIQLLKDRADASDSLDVQDMFGRFVIDAAGEFLFGVSDWNTLDAPLSSPEKAKASPVSENDKYKDFVEAVETLQIAALERQPFGNLWPLRELFKDVSADANRTIDEWVEPLIHRAMNAKAKRGSDDRNLEEGSFLDHMVHSTNNIRLIRDELVNILVAARDTTTSLLTFLFYLLSLHPEVLSKLRSEILAAVPVGAPTHDDVRKLRYLRACLNETLRLFPPIPANRRASVRGCVLPVSGIDEQGNTGPIYVPGPGIPLFFSPFSIQRRKDVWGEDADNFIPDRWIDPNRLKDFTADPSKFLPFNAGPRICPGQNFSYNEASFLVIRILQNFDTLEMCQEDAPPGSQPPAEWKSKGGRHAVEKIWPKSGLVTNCKGGLWMRMKLAQ